MASSPSHFCCTLFSKLIAALATHLDFFHDCICEKRIQTSASHLFGYICTYKYYVTCLILVQTFNSLHCFAKLRLLPPLELWLLMLLVLLSWRWVLLFAFSLFALLSQRFCALFSIFYCCKFKAQLDSQSYLLAGTYIHTCVNIFANK